MFFSLGTLTVIFAVAYFLFKRMTKRKIDYGKACPTTAGGFVEKIDETKVDRVKVLKKPAKFEHRKKGSTPFTHPWLSTILKGHTSPVLDFDFSTNGRYVVSCDEDRSVIVWRTNEFEQKDHKTTRTTLDFDHASKLGFAPDSKSLLLYLHHDNKIVVYKMAKKEPDSGTGSKIVEVEGVEIKCDVHKMDVICVDISCNGKFLMTASSDTTVVVWDLKGKALKILDTKQGNNNHAKVSPCGRFVACSGFTPDVKIWEVNFAKNGEFSDVVRAFELKGHKSGVLSFDFNQDSTRMVSASKDGTWRLWDTDVRYRLGQEPRAIGGGTLESLRGAQWVAACLAPDSRVVAVACDRTLQFFGAQSGESLGRVTDPDSNFALPFSIGLKFTADSKYLVTVREKQLLVFHNVPGYVVLSQEAQQLVKKATSAAHKERLIQQAEEAALMAAKFPFCNED